MLACDELTPLMCSVGFSHVLSNDIINSVLLQMWHSLTLEHSFQGNIDFPVLCMQEANCSSFKKKKSYEKETESFTCLFSVL